MKKILFYTNQFFGQIGGEEYAYTKPMIKEGPKGNANAFAPYIEGGEIVATIICGDNYFAENIEEALGFIKEQLDAYKPDILLAGPAYNAGRFGLACGEVCKYATTKYGIPAITGLFYDNPAVEMYKRYCYIMDVGRTAASIKKAVPLITGFVNKLIRGEEPGLPGQEHYFARGQRVNVFHDKNGAERAVDMLVKKLNGEEYETELEISVYEKVSPAPPLKDLKTAKIALATSGGVVPFGNPDHLPAASSKFWKKYDLSGIDRLRHGEFESVHAGYDPVYANEDPSRIAPYNVLVDLQREGQIGSVYPFLITTTGNSTSVADATAMGQGIAKDLFASGVDGVILTST